MTGEDPAFNLDVEEYIRDLEWSDMTYDHEKTIVAESLRALYRRLEDETRGLKRAVDEFGERLLLAEWFKLNSDSLTARNGGKMKSVLSILSFIRLSLSGAILGTAIFGLVAPTFGFAPHHLIDGLGALTGFSTVALVKAAHLL